MILTTDKWERHRQEIHWGRATDSLPDTVPKILKRNSLTLGKQLAMRKKRLGIWEQYTWEDVFRHVTWIGLGFLQLGLQKGDRVIIIGNNDPELFWIEWGVQCVGGIAVCLYVDSLPQEVKYFIGHSGARFFVGEDQEQVDKVLALQESSSSMEKVIYWDEKGLWFYEEPSLLSLSELETIGKEREAKEPGRMDECIRGTFGEDTSVIMYTSGTTGAPKGIVISFNNLLSFARNGFLTYGVPPGSEYFSYAPPAWAEQGIGLVIGPDLPLVLSFAEEPETIHNDIMEIAPHLLSYAPRLWEDLARQIRVRIDDSSWWKRILFRLALREGFRRIEVQEGGRSLPLWYRVSWGLADRLVLRITRGHYGMRKVRLCTVGGSGCAPELIRFFRALGVPLCNNYGISETGMLTGNTPADTGYETVGRPFPGVEVKIEKDEILVRSRGIAKGYWKDPAGFSQKMEGGWYHTGDSGRMDEEGRLVFFDRIDEMIRLQEGSAFSPQFIETRLRFSPYIKDVIVFGNETSPYLTAILSLDFGMVSKWVEARKIPYTTFIELSQMPPVLTLLAEEVQKVNRMLAPGGRIKKFVSLHKEFDADEAELTRSRKLKRTVLGKKYGNIFQAMYEGQEKVPIEAEVTYMDGRKGVVKATLQIVEVSGDSLSPRE